MHHTSNYSGQAPGVNNPFFNGTFPFGYTPATAQSFTWTVEHIVSVILDAGLNPKGDFQHVLVNVQGLADPNGLAINNIDSCSLVVVSGEFTWQGNCEIAWIQTRFDASVVMPQSSNFDLIKTLPTNISNSQTVTSGGYSFSVGYSEDSGASANFQYTSPTTTTTFTDWEVNDRSTSTAQ